MANVSYQPPEIYANEKIRALFYLLTPSETLYEDVRQVPNYVSAASPFFFSMIMTEMLILLWKGKKLRMNDKITSVAAGMYSELLGIVGLKTIGLYLYTYVYIHYNIIELPWNSKWTWITMAFVYDFLYYWFHRCAHEVNFFWGSHQTHHSSEDYTLSTALRQSMVQTYFSMVGVSSVYCLTTAFKFGCIYLNSQATKAVAMFFYLPAALFIPPSVFLVHAQLNLLYQFWIHTELVDSLGPLEYILNTPSHHRVHHGRNPYCIDKNYAAVLIIWDRMFGTFEAERKNEKVVYGLVDPINTFDSNHIQVNYWFKFLQRFWNADSISNKLSVCFKGPGWTPGSPRLGEPGGIPEIQYPVTVYDQEIGSSVTMYVILQYILSVLVYEQIAMLHNVLPAASLAISSLFILLTLTCIGYIFDQRSFAPAVEFIRCLLCCIFLRVYRLHIIESLQITENAYLTALTTFQLSVVIWPILVVFNKKKVTKEKSD